MSETEEITINLGFVDLGQIDLLVQEGATPARTRTPRVPTPRPRWFVSSGSTRNRSRDGAFRAGREPL
jgi:hypothetical protein